MLNKDFIINYVVPTNIQISGNTVGVEGDKVTLSCKFNDSIPPVNNVTFYDDGQSIPAALVSVALQFIFNKQCIKLSFNLNIQTYYIQLKLT